MVNNLPLDSLRLLPPRNNLTSLSFLAVPIVSKEGIHEKHKSESQLSSRFENGGVEAVLYERYIVVTMYVYVAGTYKRGTRLQVRTTRSSHQH